MGKRRPAALVKTKKKSFSSQGEVAVWPVKPRLHQAQPLLHAARAECSGAKLFTMDCKWGLAERGDGQGGGDGYSGL